MLQSIVDYRREIESNIDALLSRICPNEITNKRKRDIFEFVQDILKISVSDCHIKLSGSFPLRTYIPESDLDLVIIMKSSGNIDESDLILSIFNALCHAVANNTRSSHQHLAERVIRNIEFVNARTRLVHCIINNSSVDMTVNQVGALSAAAFLEEADRKIGKKHLFKRSLILLKAWCFHESKMYGGLSILGAKAGMLSSYAISILILYIFNSKPRNILIHPFDVFHAFLIEFSNFPWDKFVITLDGLFPITNGAVDIDTKGNPNNMFLDILVKYSSQSIINRQENNINGVHRFPIRVCNIVDPIDIHNNLGMSVSSHNLSVIDMTLKRAIKHMEDTIQWLVTHTHTSTTHKMRLQVSSNISSGAHQNLDFYTNSNHIISSERNMFMSVPIYNVSKPSTSSSTYHEYSFCKCIFPYHFHNYFIHGAVRPDLLDHPLQQITNPETLFPCPNANVSSNTSVDPLLGDLDGMLANLVSLGSLTLKLGWPCPIRVSEHLLLALPFFNRDNINENLTQNIYRRKPNIFKSDKKLFISKEIESSTIISDDTDTDTDTTTPPKQIGMKVQEGLLHNSDELLQHKNDDFEKSFPKSISVNHELSSTINTYDITTDKNHVYHNNLNPNSTNIKHGTSPIIDDNVEINDSSVVVTKDNINHKKEFDKCSHLDKRLHKNKVELQKNKEILSSNNYNLSNLMPVKIHKKNKNNFISSKTMKIENEILLSNNSSSMNDINPKLLSSTRIKNLALKYYYFIFFILSCVSSGVFVYIFRILNLNFYPLSYLSSIPKSIFSTPHISDHMIKEKIIEKKQYSLEFNTQEFRPPVHWLQLGTTMAFSPSSLLKNEYSDPYTFSTFQYQWQKNGIDIPGANRSYIVFINFNRLDEGLYQCYRWKDVLDEKFLLSETEIRATELPFSSTKSSHHFLMQGSRLWLYINASGFPPPSYQWIRNGVPLPEHSSSALIIDSVEKKDEGTYSCNLTNIAGSWLWLEATVVVRIAN